MKELKLIDRFNRNLNYLRVSITDRCNLRCMYCSPPRSHIPRLSHADILSYEEILHIINIGVELGINKVRITGGEPLARKGIYHFLEQLNKIKGISDISLTTNGVLLKDNIEKIKNAGIKRLNISLDTLNQERFKLITGFDYFKQVWEGIQKAYELGFHPIKINTVAMKGVNDDELADIGKISLSYPFHMRFIEYMPIGDTHLDKERQIMAYEIMELLSGIGELVPVYHDQNDGPAERYKFANARGEIGIIRPLSHHFCSTCNRLRLTASGHLRPCLLSDRQEDIKTPLRNRASDRELVDVFLKAVNFKPMQHHLDQVDSETVKDSMSSIGG
ncbi:Molybdenum cofactor biosynthesis protein A [Desulfonema limicola]|uniref:GTP 3',8-cyclase n=1 Tax=Desulfonema limicola TaxID=45656 RepID=A0A975GF64_9BACT|nr:GTP 3',8-cyclase MoaA [Desulfonema limicola]QTA78927.1 Molybdenum cofactor biosynthesis protein A [Desulfonema limicola]